MATGRSERDEQRLEWMIGRLITMKSVPLRERGLAMQFFVEWSAASGRRDVPRVTINTKVVYDRAGFGRRTFQRALRELQERGWVVRSDNPEEWNIAGMLSAIGENVSPIRPDVWVPDDPEPGGPFRWVAARYDGQAFHRAADAERRHSPVRCTGSPCECAFGIEQGGRAEDALFFMQIRENIAHEARLGHGPDFPTMIRIRDFDAARSVAAECARDVGADPSRLFSLCDQLELQPDVWIGAEGVFE
jgi:hypothetical protein